MKAIQNLTKFPDHDYEDQAHRIADNASERAHKVYRLTTEHFDRLLKRADSFEKALRDLEDRAVDSEFMLEFRSLLFDGMSNEDALGRSYIVEKDVFYSVLGKRSPANLAVDGMKFTGNDVRWFQCKDVNISFDLTPEEVVQYLRRKAFWIAGIENDEVLKAIQKRLTEAANKGQSYKEFLDQVEEYFQELPASRPQTVFRTNLYSAYSVGQLEQMHQMRGRFPMWRYVAILDSATRPDHAALNGEVFPIDQGPYPPIDYNCRCTAQHLHSYQVDADGIEPSTIRALPENVRRFDTRGDFEAWLSRKQAGMNPQIRDRVQGDL